MREESYGAGKLTWLDKLISRLRFGKIIKYLGDSKDVLDLGCGHHAEFLNWLVENRQIKSATGVDFSLGKSASDKIKFIEGDLNNILPLDSGKYDAVISAAVIEHLNNPEVHLAEIFRTLVNHGRLILTTPAKSAKFVLEFLAFKLGIIDSKEIADHKYYFSGDELRKLLIASGFKNENIVTKSFQFGLNNLIIADKHD